MRTLWLGIAMVALAGIAIALLWPGNSGPNVSMRRPFGDSGGAEWTASLIPLIALAVLVLASWEWRRRKRR